MEILTYIKDVVTDNWVMILVFVTPFFLPNKQVRSLGYALGSVMTVFLRQRLGRNGEELEKWFQGTISAFISGLNAGLDKDDAI